MKKADRQKLAILKRFDVKEYNRALRKLRGKK